jgi:hypothetical protein
VDRLRHHPQEAGRIFRTDYRLRRGFRDITYEFQALAREEAAYPYAAGTSATKAVRVR